MSDVLVPNTGTTGTDTEPSLEELRTGAQALGDLSGVSGGRSLRPVLDDGAGAVHYYRFTLSAAHTVEFGLRHQDADADLYLEDAEGNVVSSSARDGAANEALRATLDAGTYYVRVEAQEAGENAYLLRYGGVSSAAAFGEDADQSRAGAAELPLAGDSAQVDGTVDGIVDAVDYYRFTLDGPERVALALSKPSKSTHLSRDADLYLEDAEGHEVARSAQAGRGAEGLEATLDAGTYYVRVEARNAGDAEYRLTADVLDLAADTTTTGAVAAGGSATGNIGTPGDRDWFAVELEVGHSYLFDLDPGDGDGRTLDDPYIRGIYDSQGNLLPGTTNDNSDAFILGGEVFFTTRGSQVLFTPGAAGTYYVAAGGAGSATGAYRLSVTGYADDFTHGTDTTGAVEFGGTATGELENSRDRDWFAVELEGGGKYVIDLEGADTGRGTLRHPFIGGIWDADGKKLGGTSANGGGEGRNARVVFEPEATGTYYVEAGLWDHWRGNGGTYRIAVSDGDASRAGAWELPLETLPAQVDDAVDGLADTVDYYRFALSAAKWVELALRGADDSATLPHDVDLSLEDAGGREIARSARPGTEAEGIAAALEAGTYYVRVEAQEAGDADYRLTANLLDLPQVAVADAQGHETPGAVGVMRFRVSLDHAAPGPVTVRYATADGTATAGEDYEAASGLLTFAAGETERWVEVTVLDDFVEDSGETFEVRLSEASGAVPGDAVAQGTILNTELAQQESPDYAADSSTTGTVAVGGSADGGIGRQGDEDWFEVTLQGGMKYRIDVTGAQRNQGTVKTAAFKGLYDTDGTTRLLDEDDVNGGDRWQGDRVYFTPDTTGDYFIAVEGGVVSVSGILTPSGVRPTTTHTATGTYRVFVTGSEVDDHPADNTTTGTVALGGAWTHGEIEVPGDRDRFAVDLEAGKRYKILVATGAADGPVQHDPHIYGLYTESGSSPLKGTNSDPARSGLHQDSLSGIRYQASFIEPRTINDTYYIEVGAEDEERGAGRYSLRAYEVGDDLPADTSTTRGTDFENASVGAAIEWRGWINYPGDVDWFKLENLEAGQTYLIKMQGGALGTDGTSSQLWYLGNGRVGYESGAELRDPFIRGVYDANGVYQEGTANDNALGNAGPVKWAWVYFTPDADGTYYVAAGAAGHDYGGYYLRAERFGNDDDYAADTSTTGSVTVGGGEVLGYIERLFDVDWFEIELDSDATAYKLSILAGSLLEPFLVGLADENGDLIPGTWADGDRGRDRGSFYEGNGGGELGTSFAVRIPQFNAGTYYVIVGADTRLSKFIERDNEVDEMGQVRIFDSSFYLGSYTVDLDETT